MSDAWHQWRSEGWGASDIAAAWTGRYGGAYTVVAQKAGRLPTWEADMDTGRMQRGHDLEPAIAAMVQICTGWYVVGEQKWCEHRDEPRHRATVDGFVAKFSDDDPEHAEALVEFKTHGVEVRPAWDYYEAQVQWQLYVTGFDRAVLAVATVDDSEDRIVGFRVSIIEADPLIQDGLVILARILDDHLAAGTLPDPDGSPAAAEAVKVVTYTTDPSDAVIVDLTDITDRIARYGEVKAAVVAAKKEQTELENLLRARVGTGLRGVAGPWTVTYSKPRRVLNEEKVLAEHPELAKSVLDRDAADAALGKALDDYREPLGARTLPVRRQKETT